MSVCLSLQQGQFAPIPSLCVLVRAAFIQVHVHVLQYFPLPPVYIFHVPFVWLLFGGHRQARNGRHCKAVRSLSLSRSAPNTVTGPGVHSAAPFLVCRDRERWQPEWHDDDLLEQHYFAARLPES